MAAKRCAILGFSGSIACGKTARSKHVSGLSGKMIAGVAVAVHRIDCDAVGHACYAPGTATYQQVVQAFGDGVLQRADDGNTADALPPINRRALGAIVFADKTRLTELNGIVWPAIEAAVHDEVANVRAQTTAENLCIVIEAALMTELAGVAKLCNEIWFYTTQRDVAVQRVVARDAIDAAAAERRIDSQRSVDERVADAAALGIPTRVVDTSCDELARGLERAEHMFAEFVAERLCKAVA